MKKRLYIILWMLPISILIYSSCFSNQGKQLREQEYESADLIENVSDRISEDVVKSVRPKMQVVFLLDATGSMSGLIGAAKEKIWSIAGSLSQTDPAPEIEAGMLFYRDRGDAFITKLIPLGTNMDDLYEQLTAIQAGGGGDSPESVNQALHESLTKMKWDNMPNTYRAVFLVGDCPPHMDYADDVKYPESCADAKKRDIIINTILMGNDPTASRIWKEIAKATNGEFIQTDMSVNNITIRTPYDDKINDLQYNLDNTRIYYGSSLELMEQKQVQSKKVKSGDAAVNARRAEYNLSAAGISSYYGKNELVNDLEKGTKLSDIPTSELPKELQKMSNSERESHIKKLAEERKRLEIEITKLNKQRQEYIQSELKKLDKDKADNSFDNVVFKAMQNQAKTKDIEIVGDAKH